MTLDSPKFSLLLFLLNITIGVGAQNIHNLPSKWNDWSQHPKHSFYKIESDTTTSSDGVVLRTRGDWNGIFGTSYPMFNKGKKSLNGEVKIKYKVERCKKLLLTLHSIGKNADVIKADTIHLPLSENWEEQSYPFSVDCQFLLNVSIEATGLSLTSQRGRFSYGGGYNDGTFGVSWFGSYYLGEDPQKTGTIRFKAGNWSIAHENDLDRMLGDGDDRYRTAGIEIGYKNYVIGATVYTNAAKLPKNRWNELDKEYNSNTWGSNGLGAYPNSTAYQSPVYIGHRWRNMMIRTGYNSPKVQDMTQNFIHKIGPFPYYKTPSTYNNPYFQIGSYNPFSLY
ncbi:MAG: hypothetical protein J6K05_04605 [Bacteroidaceae bacterium]|nr:hypothetical protein [Bacteroidaceae bacterium]